MKIQLPDFVIASLYKDSLVLLDEQINREEKNDEETTGIAETPFCLGNNTQRICILLNEKNAVFADDESQQLLSNLLAALHYNLTDVAIINYQRTPVAYNEIKERLQPRVCLLFGVGTQLLQLPFIIPNYQVQQYENCSILQACDINEMKGESEKAKIEKRKLWTCLKTIFNR